VNPASGEEGTPFVFNASASSDPDGSIKTFQWNFSDGTNATGEIVTHRFTKGGIFHVTLTVTDNEGLESAAEKDVSVQAFDEQKAKDETNFRKILPAFFQPGTLQRRSHRGRLERFTGMQRSR
jgi:PKD repeat protein